MSDLVITVTDTALPALEGAKAQMPFAFARALTWVAEDVKFKMAREVGSSFVIRVPWVKSPQRWQVTAARKDDYPNCRATVTLDPAAGFLADFETGADRVMRSNPFAIPTKTLRPAFGGKVPPTMLPMNLGLFMRQGVRGHFTPLGGPDAPYGIFAGHHPKSRAGAKKRAKAAFRMRPTMLDARAAGVWMRDGSGAGLMRGSDRIRFLWKFVSRVKIPKKLRTMDWARAEIIKQWPDKMARSFTEAMRTAR